MRCEVIDEGFVKVGRCNYLRHDEMTLTQKMSWGWTNQMPGRGGSDQ